MKLSFNFKGKEMPEYCTYKTINKPITPTAKTSFIDVPCKNGSYDFTTRLDDRIYYEDRIIELQLQIKAGSFIELEEKAAELGQWLVGKGELIFNHRLNEVWKASCYTGIDYKPELNGHYASLQVIFRCEPFPKTKEVQAE